LSPPPTTTAARKLRSSKSPAPPPIKSPSKPTSRRGAKAAAVVATPPASDDHDDDPPPYIGPGDVDSDIAESQRLVEEVKATYKKPRSTKGRGAAALKRVVEETEQPLTFEPKEPEIGERALVPVPRRLQNLPPQRQAVAWGALAFAVGLGATAFLPQLF